MAHLTKPTIYNIEDSNIALLGSDLEKRVRESAGDSEGAWEGAGSVPGLQIWRIEKFKVVDWLKWPESEGASKREQAKFYDGDSYIVLHTYKKTPDAESLSYDLHFWLGENTTQDEAGTAAYKTVELDDHLHGVPTQYREIQHHESTRFLSYFTYFVTLKGGVASGFHHVSSPPPSQAQKLYRISLSHAHLIVREVAPEANSLIEGDDYVLDKGTEVWQLNTKGSVGRERFKAAEFVRGLVDARDGNCQATVFDEGTPGATRFLDALGASSLLPSSEQQAHAPPRLFRLSDSTGVPEFTLLNNTSPIDRSVLSSSDAYVIDDADHPSRPSIYVWVGRGASLAERTLAGQYAQGYLHEREGGKEKLRIPIVKMVEGNESEGFWDILGA